ncbi:MAG: hypothetical protein H7Y00_00045 [Fimbriimonadaceae bacterium]|nr:hypothetical protein [Chitinophagales bacterium]
MTKAELIYNTLHTIPDLSADKMNDTSYYFIKFLVDKYDEEILQAEIEGAKKEAFHFFSDEELFTSESRSN